MAGHSKWSKIKRKKAANDNKRGKIFTRLLKEVQVAASLGGGDPDGNHRLRNAIQTAKSQGVPADNIEKAVKRGTGDLEGVNYEEITYEAYGPGGTAVLIKTLTDNRNRTVAEVRHTLGKNNGNLGGSNSVAYLFEEKGLFSVAAEAIDEEKLLELVLEAGADDLSGDGEFHEVVSEVSSFETVRAALEGAELNFEGGLKPIPSTTTALSEQDEESLLKLLDALDDLDDVQDVFTNADFSESASE